MGKVKKSAGKVKISILTELVSMAAIPLIIAVVILAIMAANNMRNGMKDIAIDALSAQAYDVKELYAAMSSGDYYLVGKGLLYKGMVQISENYTLIDEIKEQTGYDISIYWEDKIASTTFVNDAGERLIGTQASDMVVKKVLEGGESYSSTNNVVEGKTYYTYYIPVTNSDGKIVGIASASLSTAVIDKNIASAVASVVGMAVVILIIAVLACAYIAFGFSKNIKTLSETVLLLSEGNLSVKVPESVRLRGDEIGDMARDVQGLVDKLKHIISNIKNSSSVLLDSGNNLDEMATQTSNTTDEISRAIEGISKGAVSQAEEIETASAQIGNMGQVIEGIVSGVGELNDTSAEMKKASDASTIIIGELSASNDKTTNAVKRIDAQVRATNESVQKIRQAIELITSIADETSLLSLNASIEAARAGEQGRGFAVVASEIQKLAEQSNNSAHQIEEIIDVLLTESEMTVKVMEEVQVIVAEQQKKLDETKDKFTMVLTGVDSSREGTQTIQGQTEICDSAREKVEDVIQNLSAISEENAASTEETTASMEELNATINLLSEAAHELKSLSVNLDEEMKFFRL